MRLEGTLDAFSLPDIFQLLSYTKKTGTLHLRCAGAHGAVHLRGGEVTGARSDMARQALGRRLVGAGLVDDQALASAVEQLVDRPGAGLGQVLVHSAGLDRGVVDALAAEQAVDAVFDLMRWPEGEFAFVIDEPDPDDLGVSLPVDQVVQEGHRRLEVWSGLTAAVPAPDVVVSWAPAPVDPPLLSVDEWQLMSLVDGRRTVADLVTLSGRGDFAIVGALAALVERRLLQVCDTGADGSSAVVRRQQLLAALEGLPGPADAAPLPPALAAVPAQSGGPDSPAPRDSTVPDSPGPDSAMPRDSSVPDSAMPQDGPGLDGAALQDSPAIAGAPAMSLGPAGGPALPHRPEPFLPARRPEHADARSAGSGVARVGAVVGSTALQPDPLGAPVPVGRDPAVDRTLVLRLIAGVRGL